MHVTVNGEEIVTTPKHPFYVPQKGWTSAIDLRAGDILLLSNGEYVTVEKVQHEILENPVKVYNFEVRDFHTYYVGENSVLVHNMCEPEEDLPDGMGTYSQQRGHHPMSKVSFEGVEGYNYREAVTISQSKLNEWKVLHSNITGQQHSLYSAFAKTGEALTMDVMKKIEIQAMVNAGVALQKECKKQKCIFIA